MKQRREYKYLIDEATAARVRGAIAGICVPDEHGGRYLTDTLYLDTLAHHLYRATVENEPVRHKLRIRTYPGAPVFLEVKRRVDDVIVKTRAAITGDWVALLETGDTSALAGETRDAAEEFLARYQTNRGGPLVPTVLVRYEREAYTSMVDDYARVTFDRRLQSQPTSELTLVADERAWTPIDHPIAMRSTQSTVVLELKFGPLPPTWLWRIVHGLELARFAFSKYTRAIDALLARPSLRVTV